MDDQDKICSTRCDRRFDTIQNGKTRRWQRVWQNETDSTDGDHRDASRNQLKQVMMNHVARFFHRIPLFSTMKSLSSPKLLSRQRRNIGVAMHFKFRSRGYWARRVHLSAFRHNHRSSAYSLLAHCTVEPGGLDDYENHRLNADLSAGPD